MAYTIRKQTQNDFLRRVKSVDRRYYRNGGRMPGDTTKRKPLGSILLGFAWAYLVVSVASNRSVIEDSLQQGSLPAEYHIYIFAALAFLLAASGIGIAMHLFRFMAQRGARKQNSGGILLGALGALMLVYTPAHVWTSAFSMLDGNSQAFLQTASATVEGTLSDFDIGSVTLVSSIAK